MTRHLSVQIALVSDDNFIVPSTISICSVLEHCPCHVKVHFLGDSVRTESLHFLDSVCTAYANAELIYHDVTDTLSTLPKGTSADWPRVALARLLLPKLVEGKVLYLDGDTFTLSDLTNLFTLELEKNMVAAVRDFALLASLRKCNENANRLQTHATEILRPFAPYNYFNSGVLLLDCDKITANKILFSRLLDISAVSTLPGILYPDQDYLNWLFKGKVHFLNPSWNSLYGMNGRAYRVAKEVLPTSLIHDIEPPKILHFTGHRKPWHSMKISDFTKISFLRKLPRILEWRRNCYRIIGSFPRTVK